ncbi:MAG: hypothetical protein ABJH99_02985, partial [Tateyamaria sp.]
MLDDVQNRLVAGVQNLLINCANCQPGQRVLIVYETEKDGYYDPVFAGDVVKTAIELGFDVELYGVPLNKNVTDPDPVL